MTRQLDGENLVSLAAGSLTAIVLGILLVPLRGFTSASNLSLAFVVLTLVVAEFGGAWAALVTAVTSALSLDFFLTQPYLKLTIQDKHDIVAFSGLAICGLTVAGLASLRRQRIAALTASKKQYDLLRRALSEWVATAPVAMQLERILRASEEAFPLAAAAVRDAQGHLVASTKGAARPRAVVEMIPDSSEPTPSATFGWKASPPMAPLPMDGARIALLVGTRTVGWLEVWGNGRAASAESRRGLGDLAHLIALLLAAARAPD